MGSAVDESNAIYEHVTNNLNSGVEEVVVIGSDGTNTKISM